MPTGYPRDLTGQKFNRLTVISLHRKATHTVKRSWMCRCDCGNEVIVIGTQLTLGKTKSCGCYNIASIIARSTKHGMAGRKNKRREYISWCSMKTRCSNPNEPRRWQDYGGRGIVVCKRWTDSFTDFLADVGDMPAGKWSIDRIEVNGGYTCGHCQDCIDHGWTLNAKWSTDTDQARNKRNARILTANGESMCVSAWADKTGIGQRLICSRKDRGWSDHKTVTTPIKKIAKSKSITDGDAGRQRFLTAEYTAWTNANSRCFCRTNKSYNSYGGRGITVCAAWRQWRYGFRNFLADVGPRPSPEFSLDRIAVDGNYSCGHCAQCVERGWTANCRWATPVEQANNKRKKKQA